MIKDSLDSLSIKAVYESVTNQDVVVLIADPRVLKIPINENLEPLIDLKNQKNISFGSSPEIPNNTDYTKIRSSVYEKLVNAQKMLPDGLKFCLYEGYRSLNLQEKLFNNRYEDIKKQYPTWSHEEIFVEATRLVAPAINLDGSLNTPPHSTGGAIDVYLIDENGKMVDMGIRVEDWMKDFDGSISQINSKKISDQAKKYRNIMSSALSKVGFVNCPTEYWHWSYGDRYWAYHKKSEYAIYGTVKSS